MEGPTESSSIASVRGRKSRRRRRKEEEGGGRRRKEERVGVGPVVSVMQLMKTKKGKGN